jgi:hypothetical protein
MKTLCFLLLVSVAMPAPAMAANQSVPQIPVPRQDLFGTCAWWSNPLPGTTPPESALNQLYRIALAQGFVLGMNGSVWATINDYREVSPIAVADLVNTFLLGYRTLLEKPQLMREALDVKCADDRNTAVWLPKLGFLVVLQAGGMTPERIEAAVQVLRRTQIPPAKEIIEALIAR